MLVSILILLYSQNMNEWTTLSQNIPFLFTNMDKSAPTDSHDQYKQVYYISCRKADMLPYIKNFLQEPTHTLLARW